MVFAIGGLDADKNILKSVEAYEL